jgi:hypothetical protein
MHDIIIGLIKLKGEECKMRIEDLKLKLAAQHKLNMLKENQKSKRENKKNMEWDGTG